MRYHARKVKPQARAARTSSFVYHVGARSILPAISQGLGGEQMITRAVEPAIVAELSARIDLIDARADHSRPNDLASELESIRKLAHANGIQPAVTVIHAIDSALARGEHRAMIHGWLSILRDAVGCDRRDADADTAFAAACIVRYGG